MLRTYLAVVVAMAVAEGEDYRNDQIRQRRGHRTLIGTTITRIELGGKELSEHQPAGRLKRRHRDFRWRAMIRRPLLRAETIDQEIALGTEQRMLCNELERRTPR